ncbi:hypothetical protein [Catellicoccus marimammalium]|uniref:Uncharacterized protein n=1 Tax=Catellicoccus marimammalium M35/04/3 TaxID=1234409 RepID=K8ZAY0_9ENTE|nr:hypothetical protein [Catellicoccus marimammalium]EKU27192.1 hypothetical protein C683_0849 [Catellicoccus marimammalium M35/04/3]
MFNENSGYVGSSRSVRSAEAIEEFEMPLSMIDKATIHDFIDEFEEDEDYKGLDQLRDLSVTLWKYACKRAGNTSWHHTGKYFNRTNHYSLPYTAEWLLDYGVDRLKEDYKEDKEEERKEKAKELENMELAVAQIQVWGGSRRHPRLLKIETVMGVVKGDWLYAVSESEQSKYKIYANKVENISYFKMDEYYSKLIKRFPEFKAMKRQINQCVKRLK